MHKDRQLASQHRFWAIVNYILSITYRLAEMDVACLVGSIVNVHAHYSKRRRFGEWYRRSAEVRTRRLDGLEIGVAYGLYGGCDGRV